MARSCTRQTQGTRHAKHQVWDLGFLINARPRLVPRSFRSMTAPYDAQKPLNIDVYHGLAISCMCGHEYMLYA